MTTTTTNCTNCGKVFTTNNYKIEICPDCAIKAYYEVDNMIRYLEHYDLVDVYYNEMQASIYNKDTLQEFVNDDRDHFIEWCIDTFYKDKIDMLKSLGIIKV